MSRSCIPFAALGIVFVRRISLFHSSTFLLTLIYVGLFTMSALLLLGFIYWYTASYMAQQTDETIQAEITGLEERYKSDGLSGLTRLITDRVSRKPLGSEILLLVDRRLNVLVGNLNRWPNVPGSPEGWLNFELESETWNGVAAHRARARQFRLPGGFLLLVGRDLYDLERSQQAIARTLFWSLGIAAVLALVGGLAMTRSLLRRIELINQTSGEIMAGDLSRRIPTNSTGDDFDQLSGNLNQMLDRIESLMEDIRRVSDNIAHDLKTPLSRLRNHLDDLTRQGAEAGDGLDGVEKAIQEADGLLATFNALLRIARIESENRVDHFTDLELCSMVRDIVELYEPLMNEKYQQLTTALTLTVAVRGDRELLSQAVANLLDNAIKYTPDGGRIQISVLSDAHCTRLIVADSGPGIPEIERKKVFQRFYRVEASRSGPGNGLGLSLVSAVVTLHRLRIRLEDNQPGLRVIMGFPNITAADA